jgi:triacylglycerol esterase/lipase EstA (alpha/beta hydrolase family)
MVLVRSKRVSLAAVIAVLAVFLGGLMTPANAQSSPSNPVSPYGANNWDCKPTAAHPYPVVLVHGTYGDQQSVFDYLSWYISASGYCVFALDYGFYGTNPVEESAQELSGFVDKVLAATGADKVSIVGHSQGGMMPRYYIKFLGGADKVDDLIAFAPDNHGTTWRGLLTLVPGFTCQACIEQMAGTPFFTTLNAGDESPGDVSYTNIVSKSDTVVVPYTSGYLAPASNVTNIRIQDYCPSNTTQHIYVPMDPAYIRIAVDALSHAGPASPSYRPKCTW